MDLSNMNLVELNAQEQVEVNGGMGPDMVYLLVMMMINAVSTIEVPITHH